MKYIKLILMSWIVIWAEYKPYNASITSTGCTPSVKVEQHYHEFRKYIDAKEYFFDIMYDISFKASEIHMYEVQESTH